MEMSTTASNVQKLCIAKNVYLNQLEMDLDYVMDTVGSVKDSWARKVLNNGHIYLWRELTERYETCKAWDSLTAGINRRETCVEVRYIIYDLHGEHKTTKQVFLFYSRQMLNIFHINLLPASCNCCMEGIREETSLASDEESKLMSRISRSFMVPAATCTRNTETARYIPVISVPKTVPNIVKATVVCFEVEPLTKELNEVRWSIMKAMPVSLTIEGMLLVGDV